MPTLITRANIDHLLDHHSIEYHFHNGQWYSIQRNGQTRKWKRNALRISIPCKIGFRECFTITENDFCHYNNQYYWALFALPEDVQLQCALNPSEFRVKGEI